MLSLFGSWMRISADAESVLSLYFSNVPGFKPDHIYYTHKLVKTVTGIQVCDFVKYKILHFENISWDFKYFLNILFF